MSAAAQNFLGPVLDGRLLVRGVNWLGDAVMTTPALLRLRQACPRAQITLLTPAKLAELWREHPAVDGVIGVPAGESAWAVSRRLRGERFAAAIVLPNSPRSAFEPWLARIPARAGYARPWRNWLLTTSIRTARRAPRMRKRSIAEIRRLTDGSVGARQDSAPGAGDYSGHQVYDYLHLLEALGAAAGTEVPSLHVASRETQLVQEKFFTGPYAGFAQPGALLLGLNPGAEYGPAKRWPADRYVELTRSLLREHPAAGVLVFGGPADQDLAAPVAAAAGGRGLNLAGKTTLRELMALLKRCSVLITNDTGPMHVAAALGTPVVGIYGSTSPELTAPGRPGIFPGALVRRTPACAPCFRRECPIDFRCMLELTPAQAFDAARRLLPQR